MCLWQRLVTFLTDTSAARDNMREVAQILREVTNVSRGDGDFDKILCQMLDRLEPESSFYRAPRFKRFLQQSYSSIKHSYPNDPDSASWFVIAGRALENLPQIYGLPGEER